jgi:hypothetical protein
MDGNPRLHKALGPGFEAAWERSSMSRGDQQKNADKVYLDFGNCDLDGNCSAGSVQQ